MKEELENCENAVTTGASTHGSLPVKSVKRKLNGHENAVITGMSAPGTPGHPHFSVEIGEVFLYEDGNDLYSEDHQRWLIDHACCIPAGVNKGCVGLRASVVGDRRINLVVDSSAVRIELHDRMKASTPCKSVRVSRSEFTSRGFDLINCDDNHGRVLPKSLAAFLWSMI